MSTGYSPLPHGMPSSWVLKIKPSLFSDMQFIVHFYPAILTMLSMYCYRRDSTRMQRFYRRMTFSVSARKLFVLSMMLLSLSFNFCYLQSYGADMPLALATVLCFSMFSFRISERGIYRLQNRFGTILVFVAILTCVVAPRVWPLSMNLFIFMAGSMFYPSAYLMRQLEEPASFSRIAAHPATLISGYYSRSTSGRLSFCEVNRPAGILSKTGLRSHGDFGS